jgi:hypothetical protein
MNGLSLLMVFASLGVVYSWRTGADQQQEYVLQIEPEIVQALAAGEEIFSDVPADVGPLARLCITVLAKDGVPAKHTLAGEEQFRQLLVSASRYASRDRTLVVGDSSTTILWPGRNGAIPEQSYGVTTGWQPDKTGNQQYIVQIDPTVLSTLALGDELYVPIDPAAGRMARFVVKSGREQLPRVGGPTAALAQAPATQPASRAGTGRNRLSGISNSGTTNWNNPSPTDVTRQPSRYNTSASDTPVNDGRGSQYAAPPASSASSQGVGLQLQPQTYGNPSYGNTPGLPPASYPNYQTSPTTTTNNSDLYRGPLSPPAGYSPPPVANEQPQLPVGSRQFNPYPETRVAALPPAPVGTATTAIQPSQDKPWGPLLFVTFALFFSIGGNLYLAYTALEFHSRYRNAIERLRSAARSA